MTSSKEHILSKDLHNIKIQPQTQDQDEPQSSS